MIWSICFLNKYTYKIAYKVLVSDDFGVAQKRQRLIFIAVRNDIVKNKKVTPSKLFDEIESAAKKNKKHVLKHLPKIPGITEETRRFLGWKSFKWMFLKDHDKKIFIHFWWIIHGIVISNTVQIVYNFEYFS